jgi:hypothetical protein
MPKNKQICKYENNLKELEYKFIVYVIRQNISAFKPKYVSEIRSIYNPTRKASDELIFLLDLYT